MMVFFLSIAICLLSIVTTSYSFLNSLDLSVFSGKYIQINDALSRRILPSSALKMADVASTTTKQSQYGVSIDTIDSYVKCGKCKSFFYLAPEDLGDGRGKRLECSVCNHSWFQSADSIMRLKPGYELIPLDEQDLNRMEENVSEGKPYDFVGDGKLYVGNLAFNVSEDDLIKAFSEYGVVGDASIVCGDDGRSRGFAFVTMRTLDDSKKAMESLNGKEVFGRQLQIREPIN